MRVASLELCKELYKLSGWEDTHSYYWQGQDPDCTIKQEVIDWGFTQVDIIFPAYDCGYLLRRLEDVSLWSPYVHCGGYTTRYHNLDRHSIDYELADTPEDALCKLAINLFKSGVLEK